MSVGEDLSRHVAERVQTAVTDALALVDTPEDQAAIITAALSRVLAMAGCLYAHKVGLLRDGEEASPQIIADATLGLIDEIRGSCVANREEGIQAVEAAIKREKTAA